MDEQEKIIIEAEDGELQEQGASKKPVERVLKFRLSEEYYCIGITQVKEVIRVPEFTRLPLVPGFVKGIINLRGRITAVFDIREFFGLSQPEKALEPRVIVTDCAGYTAGILADEVLGTDNIEEDLIQEPLAIMKEGVSLVLDKITGSINQQQEKTLGMVHSNINRLTQLITDLLDISKIEAGRVQLKKSLVDAGSLVRDTAEKWRFESDKKKQKLSVVVPDKPVRIYLDNDKIIQILNNLISNAIKYTAEGGRIKIELSDRKDEVELVVSDNGIGIAGEDLPHVFERFKQFSRAPGSGAKGTGLGLAITKELVNLHEGTIAVESKFNQGSSFTVTLPKMDSETVFKQHIHSGIKEAEEKNSHLSVVTVRIGEFARLQKDLGFDETHALLKEIENAINGALRRKADTVVRDTGELIVLLLDVNKNSASAVKERISSAIQSFLDDKKDKASGSVAFNIGLAAYPEDAASEEELLNKARGLIKAKTENT